VRPRSARTLRILLWHRSFAAQPEHVRTAVLGRQRGEQVRDANRAFDKETNSLNDFTASAGHGDGHNVVLNDWFGVNGGAAMTWQPWAHTGRF
jgi:hypothetical protein